ncbi:MAG: hypothetical protein H6Q68_1974 [Firmicutes bacterium]|nr:hypothetical protein [Bacillota bacterium]
MTREQRVLQLMAKIAHRIVLERKEQERRENAT